MEKNHQRPQRRLGPAGESLAARFLECKGYKILDRNYRAPIGEIDIVAREGGAICFIEVKTRSGISYGYPGEAISLHKQRKISQVAAYYLNEKKFPEAHVRFDAVAIMFPGEGGEEIELIKNAFEFQE